MRVVVADHAVLLRERLARLLASHPAVGVLVLSAHVEAHVALQLIEDGVRGPDTCSRNAWPTSAS